MKKYLKNLFLFLLIFIMISTSISFAAQENLDLVGEGAILIDYNSNRILYEKNSDKKMYPASTTKIMTAILAIELGNMEDMVEIDEEVVSLTEGSHIALDYGEKMKFEDLLNGLMVASANDAANAIAKHVSGSIEGFVELMNDKAEEIGAVDTHFTNPNGLHDENHYTTAYDLFLISKYAMQNETFQKYASKTEYTIAPTNKKSEKRLLHTTNKFLYGNHNMDVDGKVIPIKYEGINGIKTGTTPEAKNCLVSSAQRGDKTLFTVVLKSVEMDVYADTYKLLNYGFDNFNDTILGYSNEFIANLDIEDGSLPYASTILNGDVRYTLRSDELDRIEKSSKFKDKINLPISKGDILGSAEYYLDGDLIAKEDIVSTVDIKSTPGNKLIKTLLNKWYIVLIALILLVLIVRVILVQKKRKFRKRRNYSKYL